MIWICPACNQHDCRAVTEVDCRLSLITDFSEMVEDPKAMGKIWSGPRLLREEIS